MIFTSKIGICTNIAAIRHQSLAEMKLELHLLVISKDGDMSRILLIWITILLHNASQHAESLPDSVRDENIRSRNAW